MLWSLLILIVVANASPVLARDLLHERGRAPADFGLVLPDGRSLFGASKTWLGLAVAPAAAAGAALLLGLPAAVGLVAGGAAMLGDLLSSFVKRRLGLAPGDRAPLLDTVPEALLPGLALMGALQLSAWDLAVLVMLFSLLDGLVSPLLYRIGLRKRPW
jgi:CDP-diglyceride synthetase